MTDSPPSSENRFWPTNLVWRNVSNASAALSLEDPHLLVTGRTRVRPSTLAWIQARWSGSWMCMYSMPTVRRYESRRMPRIRRSLRNGSPLNPPVANDRSRSQRLRPWVDVEVGVLALPVLQRVGVGHEVAADPVCVDELLDPGDLVDVVVVGRGDVLDPADRLVGIRSDSKISS